MNALKKCFFPAWASIVLVFSLIACDSETSQNKGTTDESTGYDSTEMAGADNTRTESIDQSGEMPSESYTYAIAEEGFDNTVPDKVATKEAKLNKTKKLPQVKAEPVVYTISQTDRPPLFSAECLNSEDPAKCSGKAMSQWMKKYIEYPEKALDNEQESVQYVTFVINQKGSISSITDVDSNGKPCDGCSSAAVGAVADMPDWQPALRDGKPVSVVVTLPVRFKML